MNYTKEDLRKFFLAGRRYGLTENEDNTTMSFDKFFDVYSQIQEDIKEDQGDDLTEISDEEIAKSMSRYNITDFGQMAAYVTGAKWYREKLKSKQQ